MLEKLTNKISNIFEKKTENIGKTVLRQVKNEFTRSPNKDRVIVSKLVESNRVFCKNFLANIPEVENTLKKADFEALGQNGLPLKYPRADFISDLNNSIKHTSKEQKTELFEKLNIKAKLDEGGNFVSYEGFPSLENLSTNNPLHQKISAIVGKFTEENEVISKDSSLNKAMNSVLKAFPEYVNVIGKKQHNDTQLFSVDLHILKVLKESMNHPDYENLTDKDKTVMKMAILFHDITKKEGIVDNGHQNFSAICAKELTKRLSMPLDVKDRIFEMVKNHHWLKEYSTGEISAETTAEKFKKAGDYQIAKIFAESDLKGVSEAFYQKYKNALSPQNQAPIEAALKNKISLSNKN